VLDILRFLINHLVVIRTKKMRLLAKDSPETQKVLSKIAAKTWLDEEFNSQFLSNTNAVLEENHYSPGLTGMTLASPGTTAPAKAPFKVSLITSVRLACRDVAGNVSTL
jgi:hypothetical protein